MTIFKRGKEERMEDIEFYIHKFTDKPKPKEKKKIIIICCFSEFGCEVMGALYCIPRIIAENPGCYFIMAGWYGRSYLYKHLVDEFWEVKEKHQWLRDKCFAFHHKSVNLAKVEKELSQFGEVIKSDYLGKIAVGNFCKKCDHFWGQVEKVDRCPKCASLAIKKSLFTDMAYYKEKMTPIPKPSRGKMEEAARYLGKSPVGIFARNRVTYGRNLQSEFYIKLIKLLEDLGHTPIWLGEKQTTLECPVSHIVDLSRKPEARDLELVLAIVSQLEFTVQFWTASTRLAAIMGTPYLLFESPDQLFGNGQEAYRITLCTLGKKKLALCQFLEVYNNHNAALSLVKRCIDEMQRGNWEDVIGMVNDVSLVAKLREQNIHRLTGV